MTASLLELGPAAGERSAEAIVDALGLSGGARDARPAVAAVMIASADGRAAVDGSSAPLGHAADTALLRELRTAVDLRDVYRAGEHLFTHNVPAR